MRESLRELVRKELESLSIERQKFINSLVGIEDSTENDMVIDILTRLVKNVGKKHEVKKRLVTKSTFILNAEETLDLIRIRLSICNLPKEENDRLIRLIEQAINAVLLLIPETENTLSPNLSQEQENYIKDQLKDVATFINNSMSMDSVKSFLGMGLSQYSWGIDEEISRTNQDLPIYEEYSQNNFRIDIAVKNAFEETLTQQLKSPPLNREDLIIQKIKNDILDQFAHFIFKSVDLDPVAVKEFSRISSENVYGKFMALIDDIFEKLLFGADFTQEFDSLTDLLVKQFVNSNAMSRKEFNAVWEEITKFVNSPALQEDIEKAFILQLRATIFNEVSQQLYHETPETMRFPNVIMYKGMGYWNNISHDDYFKNPQQVFKEGLLPPSGSTCKFHVSFNSFNANSHTPNLATAIKFANYKKNDSGWIVIDVIAKGFNVSANPNGRTDEDEIAVPYVIPQEIFGMIKVDVVKEGNNDKYYLVDYLKNELFDLAYSYDQTFNELRKAIDQFVEMGGKKNNVRIDITAITHLFHKVNSNSTVTEASPIKQRFFSHLTSGISRTEEFKHEHEERWKKFKSSGDQKKDPIKRCVEIAKNDRKKFFDVTPPDPSASIQQHARFIIYNYYQQPDDPVVKSYTGRLQKIDFRINHGGMHVGRTAIALAMMVNLFRQHKDPEALALSDDDIKLLQITALFHDAGRLNDFGNDTRESEERSVNHCYHYLVEIMKIPKEKAELISRAIVNKDKPYKEKNIYEKLLHDADSLEVLRAEDWIFSHTHLDFYKIYQNNEASIKSLFEFIDEYKAFLVKMSDSPRDYVLLTDPNKTIKGAYNLAVKRTYEKSIHCYQFMEAELAHFPLLSNYYTPSPAWREKVVRSTR